MSSNENTRPQPSGETREAVARIIDPAGWATWDHQSGEIDRMGLAGVERSGAITSARSYVLQSLKKTAAILALLSARPLALGGQQGGHADALEPLRRSISDLKTHIQAVQTAKKEGGSGNTITDCINALPAIVRALEAAEFEVEAAFEEYEDTTPARANAQDEGASGEPWEVVRAPDDDPDWPEAERLDCAVWLVKCPDGNWRGVLGVDEDDARLTAKDAYPDRHWPVRAHPSPTPAADADRVREPNLFWDAESWEHTHHDLTEAYEEATGGTNSGVVKIGNALQLPPIWAVQIDIDTTGDGEADDYEIKTFPSKEEADAYLADALKSTAAKEGGE